MSVAVPPLKVVGMLDVAELSFEDRIQQSVEGPAPRCIEELRSRASEVFWCMMGQPRAYMELVQPIGSMPPYVRGTYRVYKYAARGIRADHEAALVEGLWQHLKGFHKYLQGRIGGVDQFPLFWRIVPSIEERENVEYETGFDANGSPVPGVTGPQVIARMRLWVPGVWGAEQQTPYPAELIYVS